MGLAECPFCGRRLSGEADACTHCGRPLEGAEAQGGEAGAGEPAILERALPIVAIPIEPQAPDGSEGARGEARVANVLAGASAVTPGDDEPEEPRKPKRLRKGAVIAIAILAAVLAVVAATMAYQGAERQRMEAEAQAAEQERQEYAADLEAASYAMLSGAVEAEAAGNLIKQVWNNTIFNERSDETDRYTLDENGRFRGRFSEALDALFADPDFAARIDRLKENQEEVKGWMRRMANPPDEFREAHGQLKEYYDAYLDFTNLVISPSGSLQSFSSKFNDADGVCVREFDAMKPYLGE